MDDEPSTSNGIKRSIPRELQDEIDHIATKHPRAIVNPEDLDDNQKRWLFVGICLHSVLSPALRKYIIPILTKLCYKLTIHNRIDTQTHPLYLKKYPPTNAFLNYEAVHNNKALYHNQTAKYDYTIKNPVDLSKLFLQTHMVHYTGFDETCDSSALLGLIIRIDKVGPVLKLDAENVRRYIRNPWAHCDFTEWDAIKYSNSFQLMEKIVSDLNLKPEEENQIVGEINKWKDNGQRFLSGPTFCLEFVIEIRQQTQILAQYSQLVATESDNNFLKITNGLANCEKVLGIKVDRLEKDMERGFSEIDKKMMAQGETLKSQHTQIEKLGENLYRCPCNDFHNVVINTWKEQEGMFCETPVVKEISRILESGHIILIVGEPGIGKTMLMHHVALQLRSKMDYSILPCSGIHDMVQHYKDNLRQMFILDDIFGRFIASSSDVEYLKTIENDLNRILKRGMTKIVATCRLDIYSEETLQESFTVFMSNIFNLSAIYSKKDKLTIGSKYLTESDIKLLEVQNVEFTPLMCYLYSKNKNFDVTEFLQCPFETYKKEWNKLESIDPHKFCVLLLCVIKNGIIKESLLDIYNENYTKNKHVLENVYDSCGINRGTSRNKIKRVLDSLVGTYFRKIGNNYMILHDQMFDFMCCYFGTKDTLITAILRYSEIRVINERTQLESLNEHHCKFAILISCKYEEEYLERIKNELKLGKLKQCFCNSQMKFEKFRVLFLNILKSIDVSLVVEQLNKRNNLMYILTNTHDKDCSVTTKEYHEYEDYSDDEDMTEGPLITSCSQGYYDIVQYFILKGADVSLCGMFNSPLTAACIGGHAHIVQVLIDRGSEKNQTNRIGLTPLTIACTEGNEKIVQLLIDNGCDVNQVDGMGQTPLKAACWIDNKTIVQLLIDKGCDVNQDGGIAETPLTAACMEGNVKLARLLIDKGYDFSKDCGIGETPLTACCRVGNEKLVRLLIDKGCDVNKDGSIRETLLSFACRGGNEQLIQLLIDKGYDVSCHDGIGETSLTAACLGGNEKIVQLLIDRGCEVNPVPTTGLTPLTAACQGQNEKIVQLLIDNGVDVEQTDGNKNTPLIITCIAGNEKIVQLLIKEGVDLNQSDGERQTALIVACKSGNEKIVQLLLDKGVHLSDINITRKTTLVADLLTDQGGHVNKPFDILETPLIAACLGGNKKIVELLLQQGYDFSRTPFTPFTPLTAACWGENEKIFQLLIEKGLDLYEVDGFGRTPLVTACESGNYEMLQMLIAKGVSIDQTNKDGLTPITAACMVGSELIVKLLLEKDVNINDSGCMGKTPLIAACSEGHEQIVQLLLDKGSDVNQSDDWLITPLMYACMRENKNIVTLLLDKGADVNQACGFNCRDTPLMEAFSRGNEMIAQLLKNKGAKAINS